MRSLKSLFAILLATASTWGCATRPSAHIASSATPHAAEPPVREAPGSRDDWPTAQAEEHFQAAPESARAKAGSFSETAADERAALRRPGLATRWGERRDNSVSEVSFVRQEPNHPFAVLAFHYDDEDGVSWKTGRDADDALPSVFSVRGGAIEVSIVSARDRPLPQLQAGGRTYIVGETDERYAIRLTNFTRDRYEVVASVDGLDVLAGTEADYHHRGYVLAPWSTLHIEGFRESVESVRAFRFGDIEESYAIARGYGRDVGVIGVALFAERRGGNNPYTDGPSPFPGQFAQPPGR